MGLNCGDLIEEPIRMVPNKVDLHEETYMARNDADP